MVGQAAEADPIVLRRNITFAAPEPEPAPTPTTTPTAQPAQPVVLNQDTNRSLAFTGSGTETAAMLGGALLALGIAITATSRRLRRAEVTIER
jgi:hypothetical protein